MPTSKKQLIFEREDHAGVMQDKSAALDDGLASEQSYRPQEELRLNMNTVQSDFHKTHQEDYPVHQNNSKTHPKDKLVPLTTQVPVFIKAQIQRSAKQENLSTSATAAALLERAVQGQIDMQYGAMLRPVIQESVKKEINARIERVTRLALNAFLAGEQTRILSINLLGMLLGGATDALPELIKQSQDQAWANLRHLMGEEGAEN